MKHLIELRDIYKVYQMGEETVHALDGELLDQGQCFSHAFGERDGMFTISCHACRDVCPFCFSGNVIN